MIEFLQDYETKALPPEVFKKGERPERSSESELYFVQLGVAAYVVDGRLVDMDYRPIVETPSVAEVVTPGDRRFGVGGRAGELPLGIAAPQRATTGPGNDVVFGGDQHTASLTAELERLGVDLRTAGEELLLVSGERDQLRSDLAALTTDRDRVSAELDGANAQATEREKALRADLDGSRDKVASLEADLSAAQARIAELERAGESAADETAQPAAAAAAKTVKAK